MTRYPLLFSPFEIPPLRLKNRIAMAPLFTMYVRGDGRVSDLTLHHYGELANGSVSNKIAHSAKDGTVWVVD